MHCFHLFSLFKYCKRVLLLLSLSALMGKKKYVFCFCLEDIVSQFHVVAVICIHLVFTVYTLSLLFISLSFKKQTYANLQTLKRRLSCTHCKDHETTKLSPQKPLVYFELLPVFFLKIYILRPYVKALLTLESFTPVKSIA